MILFTIRRALRKAIGKPITNREHEMSRGIDWAIAYASFENAAFHAATIRLPDEEQWGAMMRYSEEWGAWLDAPYEPGKVFSPSYAVKERVR